MKSNIKTLLLKAAFVAVVAAGVTAGADAVSAASVVEFDRHPAFSPNRRILEYAKELALEAAELARERYIE